MRNLRQFAIGCLAAFLLLAQSHTLWSQQRRPKKTPPSKPAAAEKKPRPAPQPHNDAPAAAPAVHKDTPAPLPPAPVAAAGAKPAVIADQPAEASQTLLENNPALRSALEMERKEPRD